MKLAFIIPSLSNKGPNVFTKILIESLIDSKFVKSDNVSIFYFNDVPQDENTLVFPWNTLKISFFEKYDFSGYQIVHTTMLKANLYAALFLEKSIVVCGIHNEIKIDLKFQYNWLKSKLLKQLWFYSMKRIKNIVVSSEYMCDLYKYEYRLNLKYKVIPYGIYKREKEYNEEVREKNELEELQTKYRIIGACALLIPRKGFTILLEFLKRNEGFAVVIIGDGEEKEKLLSLAEKYGVQGRFKILGFKKNSVSYYKYFDIYASTSYSEGFGLAMLDALSFGIPLISSDLPIYKGFFNSSSVSLFEAGDIISFEKNLLILNENIDSFQKSSLDLYNSFFKPQLMANGHNLFYKELLTSNSSN